MNAPQYLTIPALYAYQEALISWSPVEGAAGYVFQRIINSDFEGIETGLSWDELEEAFPGFDALDQVLNWNAIETYSAYTVYDGPGVSVSISVPPDSYMYFRVLAYDSYGRSGWIVSSRHDIIVDMPPVISGEDENLGAKYGPFDIVFLITNQNLSDTVHLVVSLDGNIIQQYPDISLGVTHTIPVTEGMVSFNPTPEFHTITITATNSKNLSAIRTYTFLAVEDIIASAVFYVLRDGVPVAKLTFEREFTDYLAVGTHAYIIRGVDRFDNYFDSNAVIITLRLDHPVLAPADRPDDIFKCHVRRGDRPQVGHAVSSRQQEVFFEGDELPVIVNANQKSEGIDLTFTHISLADYQKFISLSGKLLAYRDQYDRKMFGHIQGFDDSAIRRNLGRFNAVIDYTVQFTRVSHREEIEYV